MAICKTTQSKFVAARKNLNGSLIERDNEVDLVLTGLLARENVLLVGEPGLGKSLLARRLVDTLSYADKSFELLISQTTQEDELFGSVTLEGMKQGTWERNTANTLAESRVAFLDEIFNGSSAILNGLLTVLNERKYQNGPKVQDVPLDMVIGASNVWPSSDGNAELNALFDRFMLRQSVRPIRRGMDRLMWGDLTLEGKATIDEADLAKGHEDIASIEFEDDSRSTLMELLRALEREGVRPTDRRKRKLPNLIRSYAYLCGDEVAENEHFSILAAALWTEPTKDQMRTVNSTITRIAAPSGLIVESYMQELDSVIAGMTDELDSRLSANKKCQQIRLLLKKLGTEQALNAASQVSEQIQQLQAAAFAE